MDDADILDGDGAVGRDGLCDALLRGAPDVDIDGVARTQTVVLRGGEVHAALKSEILVVEHIVTEDLTFRLFLFL